MTFQIDNLPFESELINEMNSVCQRVTVKGGNRLVEANQYMKMIPFVLKGGIRVYREDVDLGREVLLYYIDPGETCMMSLVASFKDMQSKVNAVTECESELLLIPTPKVREWQVKYAKWNDFIINIFLNRYTELLNTLNDITFRNIDERLLAYLKQCHQRQGQKIQLTHQNLANELGTTRVVISRLLKNMEKAGMLELKRGLIELKTS
jgi:CRP/FNR family transcriptional regulator